MEVFSKGSIIRSHANGTVAIITAISNVTSKLFCLGTDGRTFTIDDDCFSRWEVIGDGMDKLNILLDEIKEKEGNEND